MLHWGSLTFGPVQGNVVVMLQKVINIYVYIYIYYITSVKAKDAVVFML